jgi:tetratricopeptide (TPR) repeat protein
MELQILLAGVEFGPYTVDQARELLGEGFLSETDPAKRLNETDWLPLSELLAQSPAAPTEAAEAAPEISTAPETPEAEPVTQAASEEESPAEPPPESEPAAQETLGEIVAPETPVMSEAAEEVEVPAPEIEAPPEEPAAALEETDETPAPIHSEEPVPAETPTAQEEQPSPVLPDSIAPPAPSPGSKAIEMKAPFSTAAPTPIVSAAPLLQVSLPFKAKKVMRTGSLLAQDALRSARSRTGILSPSGSPRPEAAQLPELPAEPEPAEPPAPRRKLQLNLGQREETEPPAATPRKAIRLTGRIMLPGFAPKPELPQGQPMSLSGSGPLFIGRPARTGTTPPRASTRPLTAKEKSSFLIGQITRPADSAREETAAAEPEILSPAIPVASPAEEKEIAEAPAPTPFREQEPESAEAPVPAPAEDEKSSIDEPSLKTPVLGSVTALLQAAGTETVADVSTTESGAMPALDEPIDEPDLTSSGSLTASGDLAERRSLKITGPLKHPLPRSPIQLSSPSKPGESSRLPYSTGERPGTAPLSMPEISSSKTPLAPAPEESLPPRPETGKISISDMPNEGVRIRTRRITSKVSVPEKEKEKPEPPPARLLLPPALPGAPDELSVPPAKSVTTLSLTPPPAETVVPPSAESVQALASADLPSTSPALPGPTMVVELPASVAETPPAGEALAGPAEAAETSDVARPDKIRLRRPVKLELSSRAKKEESGRLTLEAFSKMSSLDLPGKTASSGPAPASEPTAFSAKETPAATTAPAAAVEPKITPSPDDSYPTRLVEAPPLAWKSSNPNTARRWEWLAYLIITVGLVAFCFIAYKWAHPSVSGAVPVRAATASTNTAVTAPLAPPPSAAPPAVPPAPAPPSASAPKAAVPATVAPETTTPNTATPPAQPSATVQDLNHQVDSFVSDGNSKYQHGDFPGALASYNQALNLNPQSAVALYKRGIVKAAQNDLDGAIADYTQALATDPNMAAAYYWRGLARHSKSQLDGAISDYNQALQLDPKNADAYYNRCLIRMQKGDIDGAVADSTRALELNPGQTQLYYDRGLGRMAKGALDGSLSDMKTFCQLSPTDLSSDYARLYIWLIESKQGHLAEASQQLSKAMNNGWNGAADSMVTRIAEYLLGEIPEAELVKASASDVPLKDQGQRCEAWYFIGMRHLQSGDKQAAIDDLRKCVGTQKVDYCEFILAQEELKNLSPAGANDGAPAAPRAQAVTLPDPGTIAAPVPSSPSSTPTAP